MYLISLAIKWVQQKKEITLDPKYKLPKMRYKGVIVTPQTMRMDAKPLVTEMRDVPEDPQFPLMTKRRPITVPGPPKAKSGPTKTPPADPRAASQPVPTPAVKQSEQHPAAASSSAKSGSVHKTQQNGAAVLQDAPGQLPQHRAEATGNSSAAPSGQPCAYKLTVLQSHLHMQ